MDVLFIEKTKESPEIDFNPKTGVLKISGRAYSNDIYQLFKPINAWFDVYVRNPKDITTIEVKIEYCNTIFNKLLVMFFERCKTVNQKEKKLKIIWYYEKDDRESIDEADHISKLIELPIEKIDF